MATTLPMSPKNVKGMVFSLSPLITLYLDFHMKIPGCLCVLKYVFASHYGIQKFDTTSQPNSEAKQQVSLSLTPFAFSHGCAALWCVHMQASKMSTWQSSRSLHCYFLLLVQGRFMTAQHYRQLYELIPFILNHTHNIIYDPIYDYTYHQSL